VKPELETTLRAAVDAFFAGDYDAFGALCTDDARYVNPPDAIEPGVREGREATLTALRSLHAQFAFAEHEVHTLEEGPDGVLMLAGADIRGRASGARFLQSIAIVLRTRDGLISELLWFPDRDDARAAAGLA